MRTRLAIAPLVCTALLVLAVAPARADRALLRATAVRTTFCAHCPPPSPEEAKHPIPPSEGELEGPCGLAVSGSTLYVSDYYHRVVDAYGVSGIYQGQLVLPGENPIPGVDALDGVCGLAAAPSGSLYANEMHEAVLQLQPTLQTIASGNSTGIAVDGAGNLYVDFRTHVAEYKAPISPGEAPSAEIGLGFLHDGYGLAVFGGRVYVADAAAVGTVKVFEPALKPEPVLTIAPPAGFGSLIDAAVAVDPTNEHLLVVDNSQPGFYHPLAAVYEFDSSGAFLGSLPRLKIGGKQVGPVFSEPPGIAIDPTSGELFVTDGNGELANVFAYGPYTASGSGGGTEAASDAAVATSRSATTGAAGYPPGSGAGPSHAASASTVVQRGPVRVNFDGELTPHTLPRHGAAPVGIEVEAKISGTAGGTPPQLRKLTIAINRHGQLTTAGLPRCSVRAIQPSTTTGALNACGNALVGEGHFSANVKLPQQSPFPSSGKVLAFNGRIGGKPAILAHIYGKQPAPTSYVLPFLIRNLHGTYGSVLEASLPQATGEWGYVTGLRMNLHRSFSYRGQSRSYLSAGCPAPAGVSRAAFPLARTSFSFAGGPTLISVLNRTCRARG